MKSKTNIILILGLMLMAFSAGAQNIELIPSYGYHFGSKLNYGSNYLKVDASDHYGISLGVETMENVVAELSYTHMGTELRIRDVFISPTEAKLSDVNLDWIMAGGKAYAKMGKLRPFAGGALGIVIYSPRNENPDIVQYGLQSRTYFAFSLKGGVNIMFNDRVGLNLQGNLFFPVEWGGVYVGGGSGGVSGGVSVGTTTVIGGFSGGLIFKLGN